MFNKIWNNEINKLGLYTKEQIEEEKEKLRKLERKIASKYEVIEAYSTSPRQNQKRILANQKEIDKLEIEKASLISLIKEMEEKNVD